MSAGEVKHTPGPWGADNYPVIVRGLHFLAHAHYETAEGSANARLIASAPDLLAALRELNEAFDDGLCNSGTPGFDSNRLGRAQVQAVAAIAKAEGRSNA